jgi:hypothetical protein
VRTRILAPLVAVVALALPAVAHAAVLCVGTSGADCTTYPTTQQAIDAAVTGEDTIRFGAGTFDPVNTPKVLTYIGVGAGTPDSAAGATVIQQTAAGDEGMNLPRGGTVRSLRAQGGPGFGGMGGAAGTGIQFAPAVNGDMTLTLVDVIATGGAPAPASTLGGAGLALGGSLTATGSKVANVTGGAFLGGTSPTTLGQGVYTCCIQSTFTGSLIRTGIGTGVAASIDSTLTLNGTTVEGTTGIQTQGPTGVTVNRSRVDAVANALYLRSEPNEPTSVSMRNSLVRGGPSPEGGGAVTLEGNMGAPVVFEAVGSTIIGRETGHAVHVRRIADGSPALTTTLRNSIARAEGTGVDLAADRASIGAEFSSFNSQMLSNGGSAPVPGAGTNVAGDPLLAPDHSLLPGSPLIDRGDPAAVLPGEFDLAGAARALDGNGDCVAAPDIGAFERPDACPPPPANVAPQMTNVGVTNKVFAPAARRAAADAQTRRRRVKRGTRFRYTLSEPARVTIAIERVLPGRVRGRGTRRKCVKPTARNRKARRCKRYKRVTTLAANEQAGRQSTAFSGRVRRRALRPGRYRARLVATDSLGARSAETRIALRIVRP